MNHRPTKLFENLLRSGPARVSMMVLLACTTGCPGDDVPIVPTTDTDGSTGTTTGDITQGPTTLPPPDGTTTEDTATGSTSPDPDTGSGSATEGETDTEGATDTDDPPECGNGVIEDGEDCDGDDLGGEDCASQGSVGGELSCNDDCTFNTDACNDCGNDALDGDEVCDGTDLAMEDCVSQGFDFGELGCADDCSAFDDSMCGTMACNDGMINGDEVCDGMDLAGEDCTTMMPPFDGGTLACDAMNCLSFDISGCTYTCGNDSADGMEVCDGTDVGAEDCTTQGFDGGTLGCAMDCGSYDTSACTYTCGNDSADGTEVCDGTDLGGEDCISQGFGGGGTLGCAGDCGSYDTSMCMGVCGDGVLDPGETCDGNDFGAADCAGQGFLGGTLSCSVDCMTIDTYACYDDEITTCSTPGSSIGPNAGTITTDIVNIVGNGFPAVDVDVFTDITHTYAGDIEMDIRYIVPDTTVQLMYDQCFGDDDVLATFDQDAAAGPDCALPPPVGQGGNILPDGNLDNVVFGDGSGDWELIINDDAGGDGGTLNEWCVTVRTNSTTAPLCGDNVAENPPEICDGNGLSQTTCEDLGFIGGSLDCGPGCTGFDTSECSNGVIAVCNSGLGLPLDAMNLSQLDTINLADMGTVADVDVFVQVDHAWTGDLDISLTNDTAAITVDLVSDQCGTQNDVWAFYNDEGNGLADCTDPYGFEGNLTPEQPLDVFDTLPIAGDWTLNVVDDFGAFDDGTWNEWCIYITPA